MAKAKSGKPSGGKNGSTRVDSKAKSAEEIQKIRNKVNNLIFQKSQAMAERVVQTVTEGGQVAALKYLWEMSGLFPFESSDENGERESLAKILLERMGLGDKIPATAADDGGDVESEDDEEDELQPSD